MRTDNPVTGIFGARVGEKPTDESSHFYRCLHCGQSVDMRDFGEVFHHEDEIHQPLPTN